MSDMSDEDRSKAQREKIDKLIQQLKEILDVYVDGNAQDFQKWIKQEGM